MARSKYIWICPKCGAIQGSDVNPKYITPPVHRDEKKHHHNRPVTMELQE